MTSSQISHSQIQELVQKSNTAPSPDNCQPWKFEWDGQTLSIFHLASRAEHPLNPKFLISHLSLGCLLETLQIAASQMKLQTQVQLGDFSEAEGACWARVVFSESKSPYDPLFHGLEKRTTDRRLFFGGKEELQKFKVELGDNPSAQVHTVTETPKLLMDYFLDSEQMLMQHPNALGAVMSWVRFSVAEARVSGDGLSWKNMLVKPWEIPAMMLFKKFPASVRTVAPLLTSQHRQRSRQQLISSAGLVCVSVSLKSGKVPPLEVSHGGRAMMRAWLKLSLMGFGAHPASFLTIPQLYVRQGAADPFFSSKAQHFENGEKLLRQTFGLSEDRFPLWILRTGKSTPLPLKMRTFRKPTEDILTFKDSP